MLTWPNGTMPAGLVAIDLVGHEGGNSKAQFCFTLDITYIATGRTEIDSVNNKAQKWVFAAIMQATARFPFRSWAQFGQRKRVHQLGTVPLVPAGAAYVHEVPVLTPLDLDVYALQVCRGARVPPQKVAQDKLIPAVRAVPRPSWLTISIYLAVASARQILLFRGNPCLALCLFLVPARMRWRLSARPCKSPPTPSAL
jgi:hypothetical protein